uniref:DUF4283 domain-containing protein n=1 Tax=Ananas comosus var. bracteatus TaxID=296719 RepID=A0A6V7Q5M6_ANACO|nr:unnamed protein product [Ananas comosus var. bracteatus]
MASHHLLPDHPPLAIPDLPNPPPAPPLPLAPRSQTSSGTAAPTRSSQSLSLTTTPFVFRAGPFRCSLCEATTLSFLHANRPFGKFLPPSKDTATSPHGALSGHCATPSQTSGHRATSLPESIPDTRATTLLRSLSSSQTPSTGQPYLPAVWLSLNHRHRPDNLAEVISGGLATRVGHWSQSSFFDGFSFRFSNWVETRENERGHLLHKVWIKLHHWPILCWNVEDVKAAVSSFGALWDVDTRSESCLDEANPILLGEDLDSRLGLDSRAAQEAFLRLTGFTSVPPASSERGRSRPGKFYIGMGEALLDNGDHQSSFTVGMAEAHLDDGNRRCTKTVRMTEAHLDNGNRRCTNKVRMTVAQPVDVIHRNTFPGSECGGLLPEQFDFEFQGQLSCPTGEDSPNPLACTLALPRGTEQQNEAGLGPACELPPLPIAEADHLIPDLGRSDEPFERTEPGLGLSRELLPQPMADADPLLPDLGLGRLEPIEVIPTPSLIRPPSLSDFSPGIGSPANDAAMIRASSSALVARVPPLPSPFAWTARRQESSLPFGEALDLPPKTKAYP